jgi:hypothetical protein
MKSLLVFLLALIPSFASGETEKHYQSIFAKAIIGKTEVIMGKRSTDTL